MLLINNPSLLKKKMILSTQLKGKIVEYQVVTKFLELGYIVSQPLVDCRYDFLVDIGDVIYKVQVKKSSKAETSGAFTFRTSNTHVNTKGTIHRDYKDDVDFFATIWEDKCYLVPISICGVKNKTLRLDKPKNNIQRNITWAKDYELQEVVSRLVE